MSAVWFVGFSLIWTGLLAIGAAALTREPVPARFAHTIWRGAAFLTVTPWILLGLSRLLPDFFSTPIPDVPYVGGAAEAVIEAPVVQTAVETASLPWLAWSVAGFVLIGWIARLGINAICQLRLQRIKQNAVANDVLSARRWARALGLPSAPKIALMQSGSPFLAGVMQRTIYLPKCITDQADADIILAHECTHIARGDLLTRPFERVVADIFWFSPFAWLIRRQLDYWREAACDEQTAALTGDSVAYARALANTARVTRPLPNTPLPVAAFILPRRETLKKRLQQLLGGDDQKPRRILAVAGLVMGLVLAPLSLAQVPSVAKVSIPFSHAVILDAKAKVSSPFGERFDPVWDKKHFHTGVDIAAEKYALVYAPAEGKVITAKSKDGYGKTVDIAFKDGTKMRMSQLAKILVKEGDRVWPGQKLGKVGQSGRATGPHLHLEVWKDGEALDPEQIDGLTLCENCCADDKQQS